MLKAAVAEEEIQEHIRIGFQRRVRSEETRNDSAAMTLLLEARETLRDPERRRAYLDALDHAAYVAQAEVDARRGQGAFGARRREEGGQYSRVDIAEASPPSLTTLGFSLCSHFLSPVACFQSSSYMVFCVVFPGSGKRLSTRVALAG